MITYGSVCSGIEAASVAWEPLGMGAAWLSQYDPDHNYKNGPDFPSAVLAHHWPHVPNLGDFTVLGPALRLGALPAPDVLVGGTPCQAFSVAGLRSGLSDARGQLTLEYVRLLNEIDNQREQPAIAVWENVPGVLTSKDNAFGCFLGALAGEDCELQPPGRKWENAGCVFGPQRTVAWRVLDAQYFGVAQRRKRVFVVASARDGFSPLAVLFEPESERRDTAPSREAGQSAAGSTGTRSHWDDPPLNQSHNAVVTYPITDKATRHAGKTGVGSGNGLGIGKPTDPSPTLTAGDKHAVAIAQNSRGELRLEGGDGSRTGALSCGGGKPGQGHPVVATPDTVRRLTPVECERLQGFPDNFTLVPWRGGLAPDGHRYKALGNSMAVPVMQWIGRRLLEEINQ